MMTGASMTYALRLAPVIWSSNTMYWAPIEIAPLLQCWTLTTVLMCGMGHLASLADSPPLAPRPLRHLFNL